MCIQIELCTCIVYTFLGLQEMDIVKAAKDGSLEKVSNALKAGVHVDTIDNVRE